MKKMLLSLFIFLAVLCITNAEAFGQSAGLITIDSVSAQPGEQIALDVRLEGNSYDISGLFVPIKYPNSALTFDSVSFAGSFVTADFTPNYSTEIISGSIVINYIVQNWSTPLPTIPAANGIIGTLFFTVDNDAPPGNFKIDSINHTENIGTYIYENRIYLSDPSGLLTYYPDFSEGSIAVMVPTGIDDDITNSLPADFSLSQNYPNPFNPTTSIEFSLPSASQVSLEVFNVLGQKVTTLADGHYSAGVHRLEFNASDHPSGVFFYRLKHQNGVETKKMLLVK